MSTNVDDPIDDITYDFRDGRIWVDLAELTKYISDGTSSVVNNRNTLVSIMRRNKVTYPPDFIMGFLFAMEGLLGTMTCYGETKESLHRVNNFDDLLKEWGDDEVNNFNNIVKEWGDEESI